MKKLLNRGCRDSFRGYRGCREGAPLPRREYIWGIGHNRQEPGVSLVVIVIRYSLFVVRDSWFVVRGPWSVKVCRFCGMSFYGDCAQAG